jgi:hypothetical protein
MAALGGIGHTLPFLVHNFNVATIVAILVVLVELASITWVRHLLGCVTASWTRAPAIGCHASGGGRCAV